MKSSTSEIISLFGHSFVYNQSSVRQRLCECLEKLILQGAKKFLVGAKGGFDNLALNVLRQLKQKYEHICICVVLTSLYILKKDEFGFSRADGYNDVETFVYDIEEEHYKNRITKSNKKMIDDSNIVVCYVDEVAKYSGAKQSFCYAKKQNKKVIDIFDKKLDKFLSRYLI
ncbi:MAG: SLOG family protein [Christensenellales bacterium]